MKDSDFSPPNSCCFKRWLGIIFFCFCFFQQAAAQSLLWDSISTLRDETLVNYVDRQGTAMGTSKNSATAQKLFATIESRSKQNRNVAGQVAANIFLGRYYKTIDSNRLALSYYEAAFRLAEGKNDWKLTIPILLHETGWLYYQNDQNAKGLENLIKADMQMERLGYDHFSKIATYLYETGYAYAYYYEDFAAAEKYIRKAMTYPATNAATEVLTLNMLGLLQRANSNLSASTATFRSALQKAYTAKDTANIGEVSGNIGYNYFLQGQLDSAALLMEKDYHYSYAKSNWSSACLASMMLANISLARQLPDVAKRYLDTAASLVDARQNELTKKALYTIKTGLYKTKVVLAKRAGNPAAVVAAQDSLIHYSNELFYTKDGKAQAAIQVKLLKDNNDYQLELLRSEERRKVLLRNAIIVLALLATVIAILIARQQKQKARATEDKLLDYTNRLTENKQLLDQFKTQMEQLKTEPGKAESELEGIFQKLRSRTLLTEEDRQLFKADFERIYKNFFAIITEQIPDITPAEMRLLALTKLSLSTKEMAELQGVSTDAITKARYRLKKKIELRAKESTSLKTLLKSIDQQG